MDFEVSERTREIAGAARAVLDGEVLPLEARLSARRPRGGGGRGRGPAHQPPRARPRGPPPPPCQGGAGLPLAEFAHVSEELGRSPLGHYVFNCQAPDAGNMELLLQHGTPEQQERWLAPLARGEMRSCFAMTEPEHAGSNPILLSHHRPARRRRLRDRRPQVVHLRRPTAPRSRS